MCCEFFFEISAREFLEAYCDLSGNFKQVFKDLDADRITRLVIVSRSLKTYQNFRKENIFRVIEFLDNL